MNQSGKIKNYIENVAGMDYEQGQEKRDMGDDEVREEQYEETYSLDR